MSEESTTSSDLDLLTPEETAHALKSNERTLERWRADGNGPAYVKVGRRVAYRRSDLLSWIERCTIDCEPSAPKKPNGR